MSPSNKSRLNRITTRSGDDGSTGLADGSRLTKTHPRIDAIGDVDELNCQIGLLRAVLPGDDPLDEPLQTIQHRLFDVGGALSMPDVVYFTEQPLHDLDAWIDSFNSTLPALTNFVIPAGDEGVTRAHVARAVCRRAERGILRLQEDTPAEELDLPARYLNRLSDLLFVMGRTLALRPDGPGEQLWAPARQAPD